MAVFHSVISCFPPLYAEGKCSLHLRLKALSGIFFQEFVLLISQLSILLVSVNSPSQQKAPFIYTLLLLLQNCCLIFLFDLPGSCTKERASRLVAFSMLFISSRTLALPCIHFSLSHFEDSFSIYSLCSSVLCSPL